MQTCKLSVRELCFIGLFAGVIAICAQLSIPMPGGVPMTLQTWGISLAGMVLGAKKGAIATVVYVMLGAVGIPVFSNFTGGMGVIFGPTGGFILTFPIMAWLAGIGEGKGSTVWLVFGLIAGTVINFIVGMLYFGFVASSNLHAAFIAAVLPFIPSAVIRIVVLPIVGKGIRSRLSQS